MEDEISNQDYVGHGHPPRHSRFKPGHSGNPSGRPRGVKGVGALLDDALEAKVTITDGAKRIRMTKLEAAVRKLADKAAEGDTRSVQLLFDEMRRRQPKEVEDAWAEIRERMKDARERFRAKLAKCMTQAPDAADSTNVPANEPGAPQDDI